MRVAIMKLTLTAVLALAGITPHWCGACGEMFTDGGGYVEGFGLCCDDCADHWGPKLNGIWND